MTRKEALDHIEQAYEVIRRAPWSADAEDIAEAVGVSRVTARRLMYRLGAAGRVFVYVHDVGTNAPVRARVIR